VSFFGLRALIVVFRSEPILLQALTSGFTAAEISNDLNFPSDCAAIVSALAFYENDNQFLPSKLDHQAACTRPP
jgi:hypothetical protein